MNNSKIDSQNDKIQQLLKICDFLYETYLEHGEKIVHLE